MDSSTQITYDYLRHKYKRATMGKKEMASELGVSLSTLDLYISKGIGLPKYKKASKAKNARIIFNIYDVAVYLTSDQIETM